jgi:hypothetical protein
MISHALVESLRSLEIAALATLRLWHTGMAKAM